MTTKNDVSHTNGPCDKCDGDGVVVQGFDARSGRPGRNLPCPKCGGANAGSEQDVAVGACPFPANVDPQRHADWVAGWHARTRRTPRCCRSTHAAGDPCAEHDVEPEDAGDKAGR